MRTRRVAGLALVAGLATASVAVATLTGGSGPTDVGDVGKRPAGPARQAASSAPPALLGQPVPSTPTAQDVPRPVQVEVPRLRVRAGVRPVGVRRDGAMAIPRDVRRAGWYRFGPAPGSAAGSAVIAAHVDSRTQGRGAFFDLAVVDVGDRVRVTRADGSRVTYRVVARERITKRRLPTDELFARQGAPRLTLITCGGEFDRRTGSYEDNVVVTAVPVRSS